MLRCSACKKMLTEDSFWRRSSRKRGYASQCKKCLDRYRKTDKMRAKRIKWTRAWRKANPERCKEYAKQYQLDNKESVREYRREYEKEYWKEHRVEATQKVAKWLRAHPEKSNEYNERYRSRKLGIPGHFTEKEFLELKQKYNNKCLCCGSDGPIHADHVIPIGEPGSSNFIDNIQPLCRSCNSSKGHKTIDYRREA